MADSLHTQLIKLERAIAELEASKASSDAIDGLHAQRTLILKKINKKTTAKATLHDGTVVGKDSVVYQVFDSYSSADSFGKSIYIPKVNERKIIGVSQDGSEIAFNANWNNSRLNYESNGLKKWSGTIESAWDVYIADQERLIQYYEREIRDNTLRIEKGQVNIEFARNAKSSEAVPA